MAKTIVVGGAGTRADASDTNGGAFEGSRTWSDFQGANGAAIDTATGASISDNGSGFVRITSAGDFANSLVDVYAYCDFAATYTDGIYNITAVDGSGPNGCGLARWLSEDHRCTPPGRNPSFRMRRPGPRHGFVHHPEHPPIGEPPAERPGLLRSNAGGDHLALLFGALPAGRSLPA